MQRIDRLIKIVRVGALALIVACGFVIGQSQTGCAADETSDSLEKARVNAEKARVDAEKAMSEAERAMAEAEDVIRKAQEAKARATEQKAKAMEKMVRAGYFPDDITLSDVEGKSIAVFSHKKHTTREKLRCIECHPKVFAMKVDDRLIRTGQLTMEEMKKGKFCGNCHNGRKAFDVADVATCRRCHPRR